MYLRILFLVDRKALTLPHIGAWLIRKLVINGTILEKTKWYILLYLGQFWIPKAYHSSYNLVNSFLIKSQNCGPVGLWK